MGDFLKFPMEIISLIVDCKDALSTKDVCNLRLTCRDVERIIFDQFAKEYFSIRQINLHPISVQNLVDISNHPQFSKSVRKVIICDEFCAALANQWSDDTQRSMTGMRTSRSGEGWELIGEALGRFPNCRVIEDRDFVGQTRRPRDGTNWRSYGVKHIEAEENVRFLTAKSSNDFFSFKQAMLKAISEASSQQLRLESLECINRNVLWNVLDLHFTPRMEPGLKRAFASLNTLMLSLKLPDNGLSTDVGTTEFNSYFASFLDLIPNLNRLRLNIASPDFQPSHLQPFIEAIGNKSTLRSIELGKLVLNYRQGWVRLIDNLKEHGQIQELSFYGITLHLDSDAASTFDDDDDEADSDNPVGTIKVWKRAIGQLRKLTTLKSVKLLDCKTYDYARPVPIFFNPKTGIRLSKTAQITADSAAIFQAELTELRKRVQPEVSHSTFLQEIRQVARSINDNDLDEEDRSDESFESDENQDDLMVS